MATNLVIVESPAKAKTIEKFLGKEYVVRASLGHVRDLPKSKLGVDIAHDFRPEYVVPQQSREVIKKLREQAKQAEAVYLATDPDREGEAIAWHLTEAIGLDSKQVRRIEFHEITKQAVQQALKHPRQIDSRRVDAQQARRVLDRLVGYGISPLLWRKVKSGLSAGRVQSVAVRLIVEREREIQAFQAEEYWTVEADFAKRGPSGGRGRKKPAVFRAMLAEFQGKKPELKTRDDADAVLRALEGAVHQVADVRRREQQRHPAAPFTTSTLQQEASRKLGFSTKRTMAVAQQLYEGVTVGKEGEVGLITYMRTDSTNVAESAVAEARQYIASKFGGEMVPEAARVYKTKSRLAQEAHEAIRPTSVFREPASLRAVLTHDQFRLYDLIWKRFVASQMASALFDVTTVDVAARVGEHQVAIFRASGSLLKFAGFLSVYMEGRDDAEVLDEEKQPLPELAVGEPLDLLALLPEQHFTQPPPRYSEATLVKALEEKGIGRPSTYAPTISTIIERGYVERVEKRLRPTDLGTIVNDLLVQHFPNIVDVDFTATMEEQLDDIANGEKPWVPVVRSFYEPFSEKLSEAGETMERVRVPAEPTDEICEKCGRPMVIKLGRFGRFMACSGFPECRNAKPLQTKVGVPCPKCGGDIVERKSRRGRVFYGCANYPSCDWVSWYRPVPEPCPRCGGLQVLAAKDRLRCIVEEPQVYRSLRSANAGEETAGTTARVDGQDLVSASLGAEAVNGKTLRVRARASAGRSMRAGGTTVRATPEKKTASRARRVQLRDLEGGDGAPRRQVGGNGRGEQESTG